MMDVLITGADGYIGSHLKSYLKKLGYNVYPYDGDIREFKAVHLYVDQYKTVDMVIHLAALTGVRSSFNKQEEYYDVNVNGSKAVFYACRRNNVPVIYTSSSNAAEWWTNPYAVTKKIMEEIAPKNSIGVRPHTIYPGRTDMLYWKLKNDIESVKYINAVHYRDFTHIEDFCKALVLLMQNYSIIEDKIVDIGTGNAVKVLDVADSFGWQGLIRLNNTPKERTHTEADTTLLKSLGWKPKHNII